MIVCRACERKIKFFSKLYWGGSFTPEGHDLCADCFTIYLEDKEKKRINYYKQFNSKKGVRRNEKIFT